MWRNLILTVVVYLKAIGVTECAQNPLAELPKELFVSKKISKLACLLPPYPEDGRYFVMEKPEARPGDSLQQATLVMYRTEENQLVEVIAFTCLNGEWFEILQQHDSKYLYFNTTTCPSLCPQSSTVPEQPTTSSKMKTEIATDNKQQISVCELPLNDPNQPNLKYWVTEEVKAKSVEGYEGLYLTYYCRKRVWMTGKRNIYCLNGQWSDEPPKCITDPPPLSASYGSIMETDQGDYNCVAPRQVKDGIYTVVNRPGLKAGEVDAVMHLRYTCNAGTKLFGYGHVYCIDAVWSSKSPTCVRCGIAGDVTRSSSALPWHVGVYDKRSNPYGHICGGSIVATNLVVSAAHCFWTGEEGLTVASNFIVAAGKVFRDWDSGLDIYAQKSEVSDIAIPSRFRGKLTDYQDDIALLFLTTRFDYNEYVAPLCVDFDTLFDEQGMKPGITGKIVVNKEINDVSSNFQVQDLPYVKISECITAASPASRAYITSDKICAGIVSGTSLCGRDSGSGLAFPVLDQTSSTVTYYLRGVFIKAPEDNGSCVVDSAALFTDISAHAHFLKFYSGLAVW